MFKIYASECLSGGKNRCLMTWFSKKTLIFSVSIRGDLRTNRKKADRYTRSRDFVFGQRIIVSVLITKKKKNCKKKNNNVDYIQSTRQWSRRP